MRLTVYLSQMLELGQEKTVESTVNLDNLWDFSGFW